MTQEENEKLMYSSPEDQAFYLKCVEGLPTLAGLDGSGNGSDGVPLPYGTGAHSVRCLREIAALVQPSKILEIGFNMGWSAAMWLELCPETTLVSCDISEKEETLAAADILIKRYAKPNHILRFMYHNRNNESFSIHIKNTQFDLIFIDGGHLLEDVIIDIQLALDLKIKWLAMDDWLPEFGEVQKAVARFGDKLEVVNINGNIALLKNKTL